MVEIPKKQTVQPPEPPPTESELRALEIAELEERFKADRDELVARNNTWHESRREACQAVDDCRRLAERLTNVRSYHQTATGHSARFDERVLLLVSAGGTPPGDLSIVANQAAGDPVGASAARLSGYLKTALADLELAFKSEADEARKLATEAPDSGPLLADLGEIVATLD